MYFKSKRDMFKAKKDILKKLKKYERVDKELDNYLIGVLEDVFVKQIVLLGDEKETDGFAGIDSEKKIHYIWIFRNKRGNNLAAHYCLLYDVVGPTLQIINGILKKVKLDPTKDQDYIVSSYGSLWNVKYGFEISPYNFLGEERTQITYNEYKNGIGVFKKIEADIPVCFDKIDVKKLEKIVIDWIEDIDFISKLPSITIEPKAVLKD